MTNRTALRLAGWLGVVAPTIYVGTWVIAGAVRDGYSPVRDAISELAEVGASTAPFMNTAFVLFGLMALPFAPAVANAVPGTGRALQWAMVVTGLGTIGAAVFPCSTGCPGPGASFTDTGHTVAATIGYAGLALSPLLAARAARGHRGWSRYATASAALGAVAALVLLVWVAGAGGSTHAGLLQRTFNTLVDLWWAATAVVVLRLTRRPISQPRNTSTR